LKINNKHSPQWIWRTVGGIAIAACAILAWNGKYTLQGSFSLLYLSLYWGAFVLLLFVALMAAFIDLRFIRLQYKLAERALFEETMSALRVHQQSKMESKSTNHSSNSDLNNT